MKQKLLWLLLLVVTVAFSQTVPTNGLLVGYNFTDGNTTDIGGTNNLTPVGTTSVVIADRFNSSGANDAIQLNTSHLVGTDINTGYPTFAFWVKTTTNDTNFKVIIDDSKNTTATPHNYANAYETGVTIMLQRGKIVAQSRVIGGTTEYRTAVSGFIADGNWHHVVAMFRTGRKQGQSNKFSEARLWIDGVMVDNDDRNLSTTGSVTGLNTGGQFAIGNNRNNSVANIYKYNDIIDDIYIYNRWLTVAEIQGLLQGFCFSPTLNDFTINTSSISNTSAEITNTIGNGLCDIAYHKSSDPFSSATIVQGVTTAHTLSGLDPSQNYDVYIRKNCSASSISGWSLRKRFRTRGRIYVKANATGDNSGSSWVNAYTDLQDAIRYTNDNEQIWVAGGIYKPHASNRDATFRITTTGIKIYGGFAGTENLIGQRVLGQNTTVLSGDLQGNDTNQATYIDNYNNSTRKNDNSYHIVKIEATANDVVLDGLTISDAHTNRNATEPGGAIIKEKTVAKFTLKNCIIEDNVSRKEAAGLFAEMNLNNRNASSRGRLTVENCQFKNNMARWGAGAYSMIRDNTNVDIVFVNNLFVNNITGDLASSLQGLSGSAAWFRMVGNTTDSNLDIVNNTFANNEDLGTGQNLNATTHGVVGISQNTGATGIMRAKVSNCIFWANETSGGNTTRAVTDFYQNPVTSLNVFNSIGDFSDSSITATTGISNVDPKFKNVTSDFNLDTGSPAINAGDNSKIPTGVTTDLLGNSRIHNTTVDMGCYEYGATAPVYRNLTITSTNGTVIVSSQPLANGMYLDGTSVTLTAAPNTGYVFDNWVISPSPATAPNGATATVVLNADTNVTANFSLIPRPTPYITGLPQGNTTAGDFSATVEFNSQSGVTGFTLNDIQATGATLSNFTTVNANEYTFKVTPTNVCAGTPITLKVPENVAFDVNNSSAGNTASALKTITVKEDVKPTVKTQNLTVQLDANGNASITPQQIDNGSTDNCSIASMSLDKTTFDCNDTTTPNTVTLTVEDTAGNTNTATATVIVQDNIAPVVATKNVTINLDANNQATITASDVLDTATDNCTSSANLTTVLSKTTFDCSNLGTNTINVQVRDAIGNTTNESAVVIVNANPNATLQAVAKNITVYLATDGSATITPQDVDNGSGSGCNSNPTLSLDITSFTCANIGTNNVVLTVQDGANSATATAVVTVEDNINPLANTQDFTVQLDANGNATIQASQINNGSTDNCSIASMSLNVASFTCADLGANTVELTVVDASGNSAKKNAIVTVEDKTAPAVTTKNTTVTLDANNQATITQADVLDTATDNCTASASLTVALSKTTFTCSDLGANTINVEVTDASGNKTTKTALVTVNPNPNNTFKAVAKNITIQLNANGSATITPQDVDNGSGSGCNSNPILSLDITSFNCSNVGTNNVVLTATDGTNTATVSAVVTVEDNTLPTVTTQNLTVQLDARGNATITPQQIDNGSTDNCSIASMSLDKTTFDCSNIGASQVVLTVVDANNNTSTAAATVTVEDTIVPIVVTQDISVQLGANNQVSITPAQINNGSSDNCTSATDLTYSLDVTTFSCSEVGNNTVTLTVTDASGNSATATAQVTVTANPSAPLAAVTQNITVQLDASGSVTIQPSDVDNGSGSGCNSNPTLSLDKTTFDCSNIGTNTVILTATDGGASETATAIVTVEDIMVPTVNTKDVTVTLSNGQGSITASDVNDNSTDNCSIASTGLDKTTFDCSNLGANTVTLTVTDDQGNTSTGTATVTVVETDVPTVVTRDITVALNANGEATITAQQVDNGSSDACSGVVSMSLDTTTFQCPDLSTPTTVTLTVIDNSGNTATGTARVTFTAPDEDNDGISDACDTRQVVSPKGFSPNGDGHNDTWVIENIEKFPNSNIQVFNRWGERVYESKGYQNNWNATSNQRGGSSTKLPVGAYYYIINLNDSDYAPVQGWLYINY